MKTSHMKKRFITRLAMALLLMVAISGSDTIFAQGINTLPSLKGATGTINGHGWVDLGLPSGTKWATCNVGATSPEGYGDYFAWGETRTKREYTEDNSVTYGKSVSELQREGIINSSGNLTRSYDAAAASWGSPWHMPTKEQWEELLNECDWKWTSLGGNKGYCVTGPNGKYIFLPAAGARHGSSLHLAGEDGYYWSASVLDGAYNAYFIYFGSSYRYVYWSYRYLGRSVRPVSE